MTEPASNPQSGTIHLRVAYVILGALVVAILVLLPFALAGIIGDVVTAASQTYELTPNVQEDPTVTKVNLDITAIDEWQRQVTIRVSGHHRCPAPCDHQERFLFVSYPTPSDDGQGLPPYAAVTFDANDDATTQQITLPVTGEQIRYPFDVYNLRLGVIMQRVNKDKTVEGVSQENAQGHLLVSAHAHLPRQTMPPPSPIEVTKLFVDGPTYQYDYAWQLSFQRPLYVQILTMLLLILASAAAAYAVFLRPLNELVISVGALVLGVWGIRAILIGPDVNGITLVDLWLTTVVLFLLTAITVRALHYLEERSGVRVLRRIMPEKPPAGQGSGDSEDKDN
jgi:hypothetical protein